MQEHHLQSIANWVERGDHVRAWDYAERLLGFEPDNVQLLEFAADVAQVACDHASEVRYRRKIVLKQPCFDTLRRLAVSLTQAKSWELAAEAWICVARAHALDGEAWAEAAKALDALGRVEAADAAWVGACKIDSRYEAQRGSSRACVTSISALPPKENGLVDRDRS